MKSIHETNSEQLDECEKKTVQNTWRSFNVSFRERRERRFLFSTEMCFFSAGIGDVLFPSYLSFAKRASNETINHALL